jgi:hypothetical protein
MIHGLYLTEPEDGADVLKHVVFDSSTICWKWYCVDEEYN